MSDFAKTVWQTLNEINVNQRTEKKGKLTYLSWSWAWQTLMENYPESNYKWLKPIYELDGTMTVQVKVIVKKGDEKIKRTMLLAVMDNRNKAIVKPNAFDINNARMRCLTKAISMFGLGSYIYAGEDLPEAEKPEAIKKVAEPRKSPDEFLKDSLAKLDEAKTLGELQTQYKGSAAVLKKWGAGKQFHELEARKDERKAQLAQPESEKAA